MSVEGSMSGGDMRGILENTGGGGHSCAFVRIEEGPLQADAHIRGVDIWSFGITVLELAHLVSPLMKRSKENRDPTQAEIFIETRKGNKGKELDLETNTAISQLQDIITSSEEINAESFQAVFGKEHSGSMRCFGKGVTKTSLKRKEEIASLRKIHNEEVLLLNEKMHNMQNSLNNLKGVLKTMLQQSNPTGIDIESLDDMVGSPPGDANSAQKIVGVPRAHSSTSTHVPNIGEEAIDRLGFGLLNKVAMLFPYDFWGGAIDTFGHLARNSCQRGEFFLFYSYSSVSGGPLLVALVAGESAITFEKAPPKEAVERALSVLRDIFTPKGIQVPDPLQVVCTRWGEDKFTFGSYSYVAVGSSGDDYDFLAENIGNGRVFFAGEATNRRYPATMHGALLSGLREAANICRIAGRRSVVQTEDKAVEEGLDLDDLFKSPDLSFGQFSVLHDPTPGSPDSTSLVRVRSSERKLGSDSVFLYGLISKKLVLELAVIDGDEKRLSLLSSSLGTKLVGRNGLSSQGEDLISRIKAAKSSGKTMPGIMNGIHHA
ncbi:hypothetical protein KSP39_PZI002006 [Platanthera zijinensis]|uniref:Amine oxidase domain-containing protein n=1 Tax=Platanthera zijinensis TaxID=2320716 RepID=A0AAP0BXY8_9ASPA